MDSPEVSKLERGKAIMKEMGFKGILYRGNERKGEALQRGLDRADGKNGKN